MFTGIVKELVQITQLNTDRVCTVTCTKPLWGELELGESILVQGICSTVTNLTPTTFNVEYMPETLQLTTVNTWQVGQPVHVEPSVTLHTKLSGNMVYGHVDGTAKVQACVVTEQQTTLTIQLPDKLVPFAIIKGAITINGVNLTIAQVQGSSVTVQLVPFTMQATTLTQLAVGHRVNIEMDYFTKVIVETTQRRLLSVG